MGAACLEFSLLQEVFLFTNNASTLAMKICPAYSEMITEVPSPGIMQS
jgi:hypothetical protein